MSSQSVTPSLLSAHEREQNLTCICKDTLPCSACLLTGFIWAAGKPCMSRKAFLSLHWTTATKQEKPRSRGGKASANAIAISHSLVPWGNENTVSVWAAQRLLLLAGSVLSTNSIQASYSEEWELLLKTSRRGICIVHNDESGIKQPEFQLEVCKSFVVVELTAQNHLWNITPGKPVTTVNNNPARQGLVPAQTDSRNWGAS